MNNIAKELGLIVPEGPRQTATYGDGRTHGEYKFSDGTVCHVVNNPLVDQNLVAIDSRLGTPAPAELDLGRIAAFTTCQTPLGKDSL